MIRSALWFLLLGLGATLLVWQWKSAPPALQLTLSNEQAQRIGEQIWKNEAAGKIENLIVWNKGEEFPSLGLGHFIWYPKNVDGPFQQSFPALIPYLKNNRYFPPWLAQQKHAPWQSREQFYAQINNTKTLELRRLLYHTFAEQTQFIVDRFQAVLPTLLRQIEDHQQRTDIRQQLQRLLQQPAGTYALIDYVNFKGEGTSEKERYRGQGWGLLQVLQRMKSEANDPVAEFARAADQVLTQRVKNAPRDESRWLPGWRKRLQSYQQFAATNKDMSS